MPRSPRSTRRSARPRSKNSARCAASSRPWCSRSASRALRCPAATRPASRCASRACCASATTRRSTRPTRWTTLQGHAAVKAARGAARVEAAGDLLRPEEAVDAWFAERGWKPFPFQRKVWKAAAGRRVRPAACEHRRRQDLCACGWRRCCAAARPVGARRRPAGAVDHADAGAGRRHACARWRRRQLRWLPGWTGRRCAPATPARPNARARPATCRRRW